MQGGHPSIAIRQSNLAPVLQDLGQLEEAGDLQREAVGRGHTSFNTRPIFSLADASH